MQTRKVHAPDLTAEQLEEVRQALHEEIVTGECGYNRSTGQLTIVTGCESEIDAAVARVKAKLEEYRTPPPAPQPRHDTDDPGVRQL